MVALFIHYMAPIMFAALVVFLLLGYPVAFSLAANGLIFALIGIELGLFRPDFLQALPERVHGVMANDTLLAIPFFTFMGLVLERSGMAEDLLDTIGQLFGTIRGGLAYAVVFVGALLAATTGAGPGLPGAALTYREPDGTRGVLSLFVVILIATIAAYLYMRTTAVKAGADFVVLTMSVVITLAFAFAVLNKLLRMGLLSVLAEQVIFVMVPPLALIFLVLGTIFIGVATPTEGGAMGATGALALAAMKRRLTWDLVRQAAESTAKLSAFVIFILVGARVFSLAFYGVSGNVWVEHLLTSLPGGQIGFLLFVNAFVFVLAFFLDFFELAFIVIPLLGPAAEHLGIDLIWFGVILGVNMQTSFMHPPFGFALFYLRSVAPKERYTDRVTGKRMEAVTTGQIYWGAVPFVVIQVIMVVLVITFPSMVMHYKGVQSTIDPNTIKIEIPQIDLPSLDFGQPKQ